MNILLIFLATLSLGVRFALPKKALFVASTIAALSYSVVEWLAAVGASAQESAFVGAFLVAMSSEVLARVMKVPSPVLSIPGVIPLVPGNVAYSAVLALVRGDELQGVSLGTRAGLTAVGIASGLLLASALSRKFLRPTFVNDELLADDDYQGNKRRNLANRWRRKPTRGKSKRVFSTEKK